MPAVDRYARSVSWRATELDLPCCLRISPLAELVRLYSLDDVKAARFFLALCMNMKLLICKTSYHVSLAFDHSENEKVIQVCLRAFVNSQMAAVYFGTQKRNGKLLFLFVVSSSLGLATKVALNFCWTIVAKPVSGLGP